jgi:dTMP kinase
VKRGMFIVFEGLDRSGKSTQAKKAANYLQSKLGLKCKSLSFPSKCNITLIPSPSDRDSVSGRILNEYLLK